MASGGEFRHLVLASQARGRAKLRGGGKKSRQTKQNLANRNSHYGALRQRTQSLSIELRTFRMERTGPVLPPAHPILLQVDPNLTGEQLEFLKKQFNFEIVAEQRDGFILVATEDVDLSAFQERMEKFLRKEHGGASIAGIHRLYGGQNQKERLERILSSHLWEIWPHLGDDQELLVDIGIECLGTGSLPKPPERKDGEAQDAWEKRQHGWNEKHYKLLDEIDNLVSERESSLMRFVAGYEGSVDDIWHEAPGIAYLQDSFTARLRISGACLKDLAINYPFVFEITEAEPVNLETSAEAERHLEVYALTVEEPDTYAPHVCVIDSGVQEKHPFLAAAVKSADSISFLPQDDTTGDSVRGGGHGTRVAGAVLFPQGLPDQDRVKAHCWIQNARVLDGDCMLPELLFPPLLIERIVSIFAGTTKLFNHSISGSHPCRLSHVSAWAATMDKLSHEQDVLFLQAAGNIPDFGPRNNPGIINHLEAGRAYPEYLSQPSSRVANPAQSLMALTIGSVNCGEYSDDDGSAFSKFLEVSSFSRGGPSIWGTIKPELVERGGDAVLSPNGQSTVYRPETSPELLRSTHEGGPLIDRDDIGTSYSCPMVTSIAADIQAVFPDDPALLYRALLVQSARWPEWTNTLDDDQLEDVVRRIGYGIPDRERATTNTPYRVTLVTPGRNSIHAREAHIYSVPIPEEFRTEQAFTIRIDVTLAYTAKPRRTRRHIRGYLSTWLDWRVSNAGEDLPSFQRRALRESEHGTSGDFGTFDWTLRERVDWGRTQGVSRNQSTTQKDWAYVNSSDLPSDFCVAVIGHPGWDADPSSTANYSLVVSLEAMDAAVEIYESIRAAVDIPIQLEIEPW